MNTEQTNVAIDATVSNQQVAEQPLQDEKQESRKYYLRLIRQMCPRIKPEKSDSACLYTLKKHTEQLIEMLTLFEHSWTEEMPALQKAFLAYINMENIPRKDRKRVIEVWTAWTDYQFQLLRYRGQLSDFIQYHHSIEEELNGLLYHTNAAPSTESQENNLEGGI